MKPVSPDHHALEPVVEAVGLLAAEPAVRPFSGGQILSPTWNFLWSTPQRRVHLRERAVLRGITVADGVTWIGAIIRHRGLETHSSANEASPLIAQGRGS